MVDFSCVVSSGLFTLGNILMIIFFINEHGSPGTRHGGGTSESDRDKFHQLDPETIEARWDYRLDTRYLWFAASFINSLAWIVVSYIIYIYIYI